MLRIDKWWDECKMAVSGVLLCSRRKTFWIGFCITFVIFGMLMNLLGGDLDLLLAADWGEKWKILGKVIFGIFGYQKSFLDFVYVFGITVFQSILVGLIVYVWRGKGKYEKSGIQDAGIATGLAMLGSGCPTCGTTLLAPVFSSIVSTGGFAIAGTISAVFTVSAVVLVLFAIKRVGKDAYVLSLAEHYKKKGGKNGK